MTTGHSQSGNGDRPRVVVDFYLEPRSGQPEIKHPYRSEREQRWRTYVLHMASFVFCIQVQKSRMMRSRAGTMRSYVQATIDGRSVTRGSAREENWRQKTPSSNPAQNLFYYDYLAPRFVPVNNNFGTLGTRIMVRLQKYHGRTVENIRTYRHSGPTWNDHEGCPGESAGVRNWESADY